MKEQIRLDKYLSDMGIGTRSEVKQSIRRGLVTVNDAVVKTPETKIIPMKDCVCYNNKKLSYRKFEYYMLHKPSGCVTATEDKQHKTVLDYISSPGRKLFPVGRLDKDTEGLLLLTNDGELAHALLSPRRHVQKTYYARIDGCVTAQDVAAFEAGLDIGDEKQTLPAQLEILSAGETSEVIVGITEGRYHQVKRMFHAVGKEVTYLKRLSMGTLHLDETLAPGSYRELSETEIRELKEQVSL